MFEAWDGKTFLRITFFLKKQLFRKPFIKEFTYIPDIMSNLQANAVYWREYAEDLEQEQKQKQIDLKVQQHQHHSQNNNNNMNNSSSVSFARSKSIKEDNESEIE